MFCPKCGNQNPDEATFCVKCGASMAQKTQSAAQTSNNVQSQSNNAKNDLIDIFSSDDQTEAAYAGVSEYGRYTKGARTMRLVVGIIAIVLQLFIVLQSCGAGFVNSILAPKTAAGSAGLVMSLSMLTAGIISIAARKTQGGTITAAVFFMFGAVICKIDVGLFKDLIVWSYVSLIFAVLLIISLAMKEDTSYDRNYTDAIILGVAAGAVLIGMIAYDTTHKDTDGSAVKAQIESGLNEMREGVKKAFSYEPDDSYEATETTTVSYNYYNYGYDYDYDNYYAETEETVIATETATDAPKQVNKPKQQEYQSIGYGAVDVTSAGLYLRHVCDLDAEWIILVPDETILELYDCGDSDWYYTEYDGEKGYVYADYVRYIGKDSRKIDKPEIRSFDYPYRKGEINCKSDIVPGYSTSYIVDGGGMSKECESLGDTWHVTAQNYCCTKGTVWYELWDTDDGDYYGWVDSEHIKFYW